MRPIHYNPVFLKRFSGMKQMSRKLWLSLLGLIVVVWLSGCAKEGGQSGPAPVMPAHSHFHLDGGWVSSGGDILKDGVNPWWLRNTTDVNFCIAIDEKSVTVDLFAVSVALEKALEFWKKDFADHQAFVEKMYDMKPQGAEVAQQKFHNVRCDQNPDLRIVFGYGALNEIEKANIVDTDRLVARAIRTDYDRVNLKGKGTLYFASDTGPHALKQNTYAHPWEEAHVLLRAFAHELGHVFGVPHIRNNHENVLMAEHYLDSLFFEMESLQFNKEKGAFEVVRRNRRVREQKYNPVKELNLLARFYLPPFFAPIIYQELVSGYMHAEKGSNAHKYFGLEKDEHDFVPLSMTYEAPKDGKSVLEGAKILVGAEAMEGRKEQKLGFIDQMDFRGRFTTTVNIKLTKEQTVYPNVANPEHTIIVGASITEFFGPATFHPEDKSGDRQVHVHIDPVKGIEVSGQIDGRLLRLDGTIYRKHF